MDDLERSSGQELEIPDFMKLFLALDPETRRECGDESCDEEEDWMVEDVYSQDW